MTISRMTLIAVFTMLAGLLVAGAARADDLADLKKSFAERYPKLVEAKRAGTIGETYQGWVEAVKPPVDDATDKLIDAENADRKKLYKILAEKEGTTPDLVAERNALRNFEKARSGDWLKGKDGAWRQKK